MPDKEASSEETPYGRYVTSKGWFVLSLGDALAVRNEEKGGATYPIEPRESRCFRHRTLRSSHHALEVPLLVGGARLALRLGQR